MRNTFPGCNLIVAIAMIFTSCNSNTNSHDARVKNNELFFKPGSYRRFTGTIAGQPVVVNINCQSDHFAGGTYYYVSKSEILDLEINEDSSSKNKIQVKESLMTAKNDEDLPDARSGNTWTITWNDGHLSGTFLNGGNGKSSAIELKEDYTDAYKLFFIDYEDSTAYQGPSWIAHAKSDFNTVAPEKSTNKADADFIEQQIIKFKNEDSAASGELAAYPKKAVEQYLAAFRKDLSEDTTHEDPMGDWYLNTSIFPVYNSRGLLVVGQSQDEYSGGAHGNSACYYLNIDVSGKKVWHLQDVLQVDSAAISRLLDESARHTFKIAAQYPLDNTLMVEHVPATDNFLISDVGVTFQYPPYAIASFADGQIALFLSYKKLKPFLKQEFIVRMGIK